MAFNGLQERCLMGPFGGTVIDVYYVITLPCRGYKPKSMSVDLGGQ
jgi:hypothetical protein